MRLFTVGRFCARTEFVVFLHWGVGPHTKYEDIQGQATEWKEVGYVAEITLSSNQVDNDEAQGGLKQLYVYDSDVIMQNGGIRKKTASKRRITKREKTLKVHRK